MVVKILMTACTGTPFFLTGWIVAQNSSPFIEYGALGLCGFCMVALFTYLNKQRLEREDLIKDLEKLIIEANNTRVDLTMVLKDLSTMLKDRPCLIKDSRTKLVDD